jgi:Lysylphosphatidylglycerol synthase TM region
MLRLLLLVCGLTIVALLVWRAGPHLVADMLARVRWSFPAVAAVYAVHLAVRAAALWRSVLGSQVRYAEVLRVRISGEAVEMLTFTGPFLAEPAKGLLLERCGIATVDAFAAVATEYLLYTVVSASVGIVALCLLLARGALPPGGRPAAVGALGMTIAFVAAFAYAAVTGTGLLGPMVHASRRLIGVRRAEIAVQKLGPIEAALIAFVHAHPGPLAHVLALETVAHALLTMEIWIVIAALGFPFSWTDPLIVEGGAKFVAIAFAFVPGQIGASEGAYTLLVTAIGLPAAAGLTLALVRRLRGLLVAAAGVVAVTVFADGARS